MGQALHQPARPGWGCEDCGVPWPCEPGRGRLAAEVGDEVELAMVMTTYLEQFCGDRPATPAGEAFERFIAWTRPLAN